MNQQGMNLHTLPLRLAFFALISVGFAEEPAAKASSPGSNSSEEERETVHDTDFYKMMRVVMHQRCVNCHPSDHIPKQSEDAHPHHFGIKRGQTGQPNHGAKATQCSTCHQSENNDFSGVPGAPEWSLAPHSMRWEGLTAQEIAASFLDPKRNGGRDHDAVMHHMTEHPLVLWAWNPGINAAGIPREKPPVEKAEYIKAVKTWFEAGAIIPPAAK